MDISHLWWLSKFFAPLVAAWAILRIARRLPRRWPRFVLKGIGGAAYIVSIPVALLVLLVQVGCTKFAPPQLAPDGRHVAVLSFMLGGALGDDYALVDLRSVWTPWATNVY